jgi:hypothetical protein
VTCVCNQGYAVDETRSHCSGSSALHQSQTGTMTFMSTISFLLITFVMFINWGCSIYSHTTYKIFQTGNWLNLWIFEYLNTSINCNFKILKNKINLHSRTDGQIIRFLNEFLIKYTQMLL